MSAFHCSCGYAINAAEEYADHLNMAFDRPDDMGNDGIVHFELAGLPEGRRACACGFRAGAIAGDCEFDDHLLISFIPINGIGTDGQKHVLMDPSTPERWYTKKDDEK